MCLDLSLEISTPNSMNLSQMKTVIIIYQPSTDIFGTALPFFLAVPHVLYTVHASGNMPTIYCAYSCIQRYVIFFFPGLPSMPVWVQCMDT